MFFFYFDQYILFSFFSFISAAFPFQTDTNEKTNFKNRIRINVYTVKVEGELSYMRLYRNNNSLLSSSLTL